MRVVLVGPLARGSGDAPGGVETSFVNLIRGLVAIGGVELTVVSFSADLSAPHQGTFEDVPVVHLPGTRRLANVTRHVAERRSLRAALRALRPDLVHAQDALRHGYVALKAAAETPVVVSVHGIVREELKYAPSLRARAQIAIAGTSLERYCIRNAKYLVAPTRYAETYFGSRIRGTIRDVGNSVADAFFASGPAAVPGRVLYSGSLIPRKRALDLVEAFAGVSATVPEAQLRMTAGSGSPAYAALVRARIDELGLRDRVVLLDRLSLAELVDEYRRAAVVALPSGEETSPMAIAEAMAAAVPVVATRVGGVAYLVDEGRTGFLVDVGDTAALSGRLTALLRDEARRASFGRAGREKADATFRKEAVAARVRSVYHEILLREGSSPAPAPRRSPV